MTIFSRTHNGLSNAAAFRRARLMVYVEGVTTTESSHSKGHYSADEFFWRALFRQFRPDLAITIKGCGTKEKTLEFAQKIAQDSPAATVVCLDRDYSFFYGTNIESSSVIYTHGYSWENDVICQDTIVKATENGTSLQNADEHIFAIAAPLFDRFERVGKLVGTVDVGCQQAGFPIQLKQRKYNSLIAADADNAPTLCRKRILHRIKEIKGKRHVKFNSCRADNFYTFRNYFGKAVLYFCFCFSKHVHHHYGIKINQSFDFFAMNILRYFVTFIASSENETSIYHKSQLNNLFF